MKRLALTALVFVSCAHTEEAKPAPAPAPVAEAPKPAEPPKPPPTPAETYLADCKASLVVAKTSLDKVIATPAPRTVDTVLVPFNSLLTKVGNTAYRAGLYGEVHPDKAMQDAARACEQEAATFTTQLLLNRQLFDVISAVSLDGADDDTKRLVMQTLRDFRRAGVDQDETNRKRLMAIDDELTKLGQEFSKNIATDRREVKATAAELDGLPKDFIDAHPAGADGKLTITTDYPDYGPVMTYATNDALRKELYVKFKSRGDKDNEKILQQVLTLRAEKAKILGFPDWADYVTGDKMIKSGKNAADFIDRITKLAKKRGDKDYAELLKELKTVDKNAKEVSDWQKGFLENRVKTKQYAVDAKETRAYFPFRQTLAGLLDITGAIYDLQYAEVKDAQTWHPSVKVYDVMRGGTKLGRIYLDLHPRENKYKHAAQFGLMDGTSEQLPEGVLVCNFPEGDELMEHKDVVTMFHEFGHLMHAILAKQRWVRQAGVATEHDFVEAPSQMFEEWAWNFETLSRFAKNAKGEVIPKPLVEKMRRADKFGLGTGVLQQMFYASVSLRFHQADPSKLDQLAMMKELQTKLTPFKYVEGTKMHTSFGHLIGYSAVYYTYMWSLVIAKDMLSAFEGKSLMDTKITYSYRDKVLARGGTKDAAELVKDFLGRETNFKAYEKYLSQ
ncbi:MAG: M3 family metallopeptidase [Myxococcaceae bacterium]